MFHSVQDCDPAVKLYSLNRSFSYIDDVAPIIARSALLPHARNQIFNVGADESFSLNDLAAAVSKAMGIYSYVWHYPFLLVSIITHYACACCHLSLIFQLYPHVCCNTCDCPQPLYFHF